MNLTPTLDAAWGISFSPFRGLFLAAMAAVGGTGLRALVARAALACRMVAFAGNRILIFLFNASSAMWWAAFAVGPRYLLPMLPFFVLLTFVFY